LNDGILAIIRVDQDFGGYTAQQQNQMWGHARLCLSTYDGKIESKATIICASRWPLIDRLVDGRWIVVAARAEKDEVNAHLFTSDGEASGDFSVGDGVHQIASARDGQIWVGYSDEGTVGEFRSDGSLPPGCTGLAAFLNNGTSSWRFESEDYWITDCYALSLNEDTVWACTYMDYPILRVEGADVKIWKNKISGARAIASDGEYVILAGGYDNNADRLVLLRLDETQSVPVATMQLSNIVEGQSFLRGRDGVLHAIVGKSWVRISVNGWRAAIS